MLKVEFQSSISPCFILYSSQYFISISLIFDSKIARITCKITFISATKNRILTSHFFLFYLLFLPMFYQDQPYL
ncbi:MAG: hypothetical protein HXO30_04140 [Prevotella sp.]|nr:hypothetical protein [Prevotella sp.]